MSQYRILIVSGIISTAVALWMWRRGDEDGNPHPLKRIPWFVVIALGGALVAAYLIAPLF